MAEIEIPICRCTLPMQSYDNKVVGFFCPNCDRLQPHETALKEYDEDGTPVYFKRNKTPFDIRFEKEIARQADTEWYDKPGKKSNG